MCCDVVHRHKSDQFTHHDNTSTMKGFAVIALCVIFAAIVWARPEEEKYTDQYDNVDIDEILRSDRLLDNYYNCLDTAKKCTPDGQKLRDILPDALKTGCSKCTDVQKRQSKKVINFLIKNRLEQFKKLEAKFDPDRAYRTKYAEELKAEGIVLPD
ncbi:hypothetical protein ILUMI_27535 [Ignelater luminosus]|uniref:Chemosensory protein n=1 Tax=Ignelater luminosus TaxID=2038154 RepID=A0A8K0FXW6_IGNLU|nr:hypothetical protein ILUMI_27535 [Ignelater luminosus]